MKILPSASFFGCVALLFSAPVAAQLAERTDPKEKAFGCIVDLEFAFEDLPADRSVVIRQFHLTLDGNKGAETDEINVHATSAKSGGFLFATKRSSSAIGGLPEAPLWEQVLQRDAKRFHRFGTRLSGLGISSSSEAAETKPADSAISYTWERYEPFFLPISGHADRHMGDVTGKYIAFLLGHIELDDARWMDDGALMSTWSVYKQKMDIVFHPKVAFRPVRISRYEPMKDRNGEEGQRVLMDQVIKWAKFPGIKQDDVFVPIQFHGVSHNQQVTTEIEAFLRWKHNETPVMPKNSDESWLESIRVSFGENWDLTFDEWKERNSNR